MHLLCTESLFGNIATCFQYAMHFCITFDLIVQKGHIWIDILHRHCNLSKSMPMRREYFRCGPVIMEMCMSSFLPWSLKEVQTVLIFHSLPSAFFGLQRKENHPRETSCLTPPGLIPLLGSPLSSQVSNSSLILLSWQPYFFAAHSAGGADCDRPRNEAPSPPPSSVGVITSWNSVSSLLPTWEHTWDSE